MIRRVQMAPGLSVGGEGAFFSVVAADASGVMATYCKGSAILACSPSKRADACLILSTASRLTSPSFRVKLKPATLCATLKYHFTANRNCKRQHCPLHYDMCSTSERCRLESANTFQRVNSATSMISDELYTHAYATLHMSRDFAVLQKQDHYITSWYLTSLRWITILIGKCLDTSIPKRQSDVKHHARLSSPLIPQPQKQLAKSISIVTRCVKKVKGYRHSSCFIAIHVLCVSLVCNPRLYLFVSDRSLFCLFGTGCRFCSGEKAPPSSSQAHLDSECCVMSLTRTERASGCPHRSPGA